MTVKTFIAAASFVLLSYSLIRMQLIPKEEVLLSIESSIYFPAVTRVQHVSVLQHFHNSEGQTTRNQLALSLMNVLRCEKNLPTVKYIWLYPLEHLLYYYKAVNLERVHQTTARSDDSHNRVFFLYIAIDRTFGNIPVRL